VKRRDKIGSDRKKGGAHMGQFYIRTQDRTELIHIDPLDLLKFLYFPHKGMRHFVCYKEDEKTCGIIIGEYESKERCLEVLDEIEDIISIHSTEENIVYRMPEK
jgi:hypothetical protein